MIEQSQGKIFLASERGHTETDWFRSYNTFNFGNFQHEHKPAFGALYVLNDETLAGGKHIKLLVEDDAAIILIPTVGAIIYTDSIGNESVVEAGQAQMFSTPKDTTILIGNPYDEDLVNFLQIWIRQPAAIGHAPTLSGFDLVNNKNNLVEISPAGSGHKIFIGKFTGREETVYKMTEPGNGLFTFVLEGAFEVQYRLLEARDGLGLWNIEAAEIEALSNDAIILLMEIPMEG